MNRFQLVKKVLSQKAEANQTLLDVGCRDCVLKEYLKDQIQYTGIDLFQNSQGTVDFVHNIENGLPFNDETYDFVVALDCLEHLNDFHWGVEELIRTARKYVIITLPNMAYINHRMNFLLHGRLSTGKYNLKYGKEFRLADRHRWLTVLPQIDEFMERLAEDKDILLETIWFYESKKRKVFAKFCKAVCLAPSWWVPSSLYILNKR